MLRNLVLKDLSAEDGLRYYLFSNEKKKACVSSMHLFEHLYRGSQMIVLMSQNIYSSLLYETGI